MVLNIGVFLIPEKPVDSLSLFQRINLKLLFR